MGFLMSSQVTRLSEALHAAREIADVGFLSCVSPQMCSEIEIKGKPLVTESAFEGLFSSVYELMAF